MPSSMRHLRRSQPRLLGLVAVLAALAASTAFVAPSAAGLAAQPLRARVRRAAEPTGPASDSFTLRYFDGRGVAEVSRMLFAVAGKDYEDARYPISFGTPGDFSTVKREEFDADKAAGKLDVAMGKVPVLEAGELRLPQSKAIERYLAKKLGLMGATLEEEAWVDAVAEHIRDINDAYNRKGLFFMKDQEKKAELMKAWFEEELPPFLEKLDASLPGTAGVAVGDKPSLADVVIFKLLKDTYSDRDISEIYAGCEKLKAIVATMEKNEGLQKWIAQRPQTMF